LGIELCKFFQFTFCGVILVLWILFLLFFPRFQPLKLDLLEIKLHFYFFYFLAMKLSQSHDWSHEFNKLTLVDLGCILFCFFFLIFSINIELIEMSFIFIFYFLSMRLFWFHEPSYEFDILTRVDISSFFCCLLI
jgi:hypothetical protein